MHYASRAQTRGARYNYPMQEIFFFEQGDSPLPREEVRIEHIRAEPYPDGRRVRVTVALTPFSEKPNLSLTISDAKGDTVAEAELLEIITPATELTMHLSHARAEEDYTLHAELYYDNSDPQDERRSTFTSIGEN